MAGEGWQDEGVQTAAARLAGGVHGMCCVKELRWISAAACAWFAARHWQASEGRDVRLKTCTPRTNSLININLPISGLVALLLRFTMQRQTHPLSPTALRGGI